MANLNKIIYQVEPPKEKISNGEFHYRYMANKLKKAIKLAKKFGKGTIIHRGLYNRKKRKIGDLRGIKWIRNWEWIE